MTIRFSSHRELLEQLHGFLEGLELACQRPESYFVLLNSDDFEMLGFPGKLLEFEVVESVLANPGRAQMLEKALTQTLWAFSGFSELG